LDVSVVFHCELLPSVEYLVMFSYQLKVNVKVLALILLSDSQAYCAYK